MMSSSLITIAEYTSEPDAELYRGILMSEGIDAFVFKDDCGGMRPHMQLTAGVQLKVYSDEALRAKEILGIDNTVDANSEAVTEEDPEGKIRQLLYRSRGWILVGFAVIPGWVSFPVAYIYASLAYHMYNDSNLEDAPLKRQIVRLQWVSAVFTVLMWVGLIAYIAADVSGI